MLSFKQFISEVIDLEKRKISKAKARYDYVGRELDKYSEYKNALNDNRSKPPNERMTTRDFHDHIKGISTEGHPSHDPKSPLYGIKIPSYDIALRIGDVPLGRAPKKEVTPRPPPFPHKEEWVKDALQSHDSTSRPTLEGYRVAMNSHEGNTNELEANKRDVLRAIKYHNIKWPKPKTPKPQKEPRDPLDLPSLAKNIRELKSQGYSHRDIGEKLGISAGTVSKIHNSKSSNV